MRETNCIVIPSRGRADILMRRKTSTLHYAINSHYPVFVVVREKEFEEYTKTLDLPVTILACPNEVDTIAKTYDWVFENILHPPIDYFLEELQPHYEKVIMLDDDLIFAYREDYSTQKLPKLQFEDFDVLTTALFEAVSETNVCMAGIAHRRGANNHSQRIKYNQKLIACLACDVSIIKDFKWDWGVDSMYDHNMVLQTLTAGYRNVLLTGFTHDDVLPRHAKGGCTSYRSLETHSNAAEKLAEKYPNTVKVRNKWVESANSFGKDITMYMQKSFGGK